jgi:hypothetical protein
MMPSEPLRTRLSSNWPIVLVLTDSICGLVMVTVFVCRRMVRWLMVLRIAVPNQWSAVTSTLNGKTDK